MSVSPSNFNFRARPPRLPLESTYPSVEDRVERAITQLGKNPRLSIKQLASLAYSGKTVSAIKPLLANLSSLANQHDHLLLDFLDQSDFSLEPPAEWGGLAEAQAEDEEHRAYVDQELKRYRDKRASKVNLVDCFENTAKLLDWICNFHPEGALPVLFEELENDCEVVQCCVVRVAKELAVKNPTGLKTELPAIGSWIRRTAGALRESTPAYLEESDFDRRIREYVETDYELENTSNLMADALSSLGRLAQPIARDVAYAFRFQPSRVGNRWACVLSQIFGSDSKAAADHYTAAIQDGAPSVVVTALHRLQAEHSSMILSKLPEILELFKHPDEDVQFNVLELLREQGLVRLVLPYIFRNFSRSSIKLESKDKKITLFERVPAFQEMESKGMQAAYHCLASVMHEDQAAREKVMDCFSYWQAVLGSKDSDCSEHQIPEEHYQTLTGLLSGVSEDLSNPLNQEIMRTAVNWNRAEMRLAAAKALKFAAPKGESQQQLSDGFNDCEQFLDPLVSDSSMLVRQAVMESIDLAFDRTTSGEFLFNLRLWAEYSDVQKLASDILGIGLYPNQAAE